MAVASPHYVLGVVIFREPIDWLSSMHRRSWHAPATLRDQPFSEYIRQEWVCVIDEETFGLSRKHPAYGTELMLERHPLTGRRFPNILQLRNTKNRVFLSLIPRLQNVVCLRYEDSRDAPEEVLDRLSRHFALTHSDVFQPITTDKGRGKEPFVPHPSFRPDPEDMAFIRQELDHELESRLGYKL